MKTSGFILSAIEIEEMKQSDEIKKDVQRTERTKKTKKTKSKVIAQKDMAEDIYSNRAIMQMNHETPPIVLETQPNEDIEEIIDQVYIDIEDKEIIDNM